MPRSIDDGRAEPVADRSAGRRSHDVGGPSRAAITCSSEAPTGGIVGTCSGSRAESTTVDVDRLRRARRRRWSSIGRRRRRGHGRRDGRERRGRSSWSMVVVVVSAIGEHAVAGRSLELVVAERRTRRRTTRTTAPQRQQVRRGLIARSSTSVGRRTTKRAPPPGRSSTHASPPRAVACSATSARPRPVPIRWRAALPRAKRSKIRAALARARRRARRPRRRSSTSACHRCGSIVIRVGPPPWCVAFSSRLPRIRSKRTRSTSARSRSARRCDLDRQVAVAVTLRRPGRTGRRGRRSSGWRSVAPASMRDSSSRSITIASKRRTWPTTTSSACWVRSGSSSRRASSTSTAAARAVIGERSSWLTSEAKRGSRSIRSCTASAISLNESGEPVEVGVGLRLEPGVEPAGGDLAGGVGDPPSGRSSRRLVDQPKNVASRAARTDADDQASPGCRSVRSVVSSGNASK